MPEVLCELLRVLGSHLEAAVERDSPGNGQRFLANCAASKGRYLGNNLHKEESRRREIRRSYIVA